VAVEYAGILSAVSLMAIALTGAYGRNVAAVFDTSSVGVTAVVKAAKAQKVPVAGAKSAYMRAPYKKPALKFLYGLGWIGQRPVGSPDGPPERSGVPAASGDSAPQSGPDEPGQ